MALRDVNSTIGGALRAGLDTCEPQYRAAWLLALHLAERLESGGTSRDAELLLAALDALLVTPKSQRVTAPKAGTEAPNVNTSALAKLRAVHASGQH